MAVVTTVSNHAKFMLATKKIDFENDVFIAILLSDSFSFDKDTHATLANVTASQLATEYGYVQDDKEMPGISVSEDDGNDKAAITWTNVTWTASGGDIGPTGAMIVYDDTTADKTVIFCSDYGTDYTITDGSSFQPQNAAVNIS